MKQSFKNYLAYSLPVLSLGLLLFLLNSVSPLSVGPFGILVVFALIYILIASSLYVLLRVVFNVMQVIKPTKNLNDKRKLYYIASIVAFVPVFLLALHSIGQLEPKDFILVTILVTVTSFYVIRRVR